MSPAKRLFKVASEGHSPGRGFGAEGFLYDHRAALSGRRSVNIGSGSQTSSLSCDPEVGCLCQRLISSGKLVICKYAHATFTICTPPPSLVTLCCVQQIYRTRNKKKYALGLKCHSPKHGPVNTTLTFLCVYPCRISGLLVEKDGRHTEESCCVRRWGGGGGVVL